MLYDPRLNSADADGQPHYLAIDSALAHPEVPMLLAWSTESVPDVGTLRAIHSGAPRVHVAARTTADLLRQLHDLLAAGAAPAR